MGSRGGRILLWIPRVLGILVALFLAVFALDVFGEGRPLGETLIAFLIHVIPSLLLLAVVALAWRREWVGAVVFILLAVAYSLWAAEHLAWILGIAGPLVVVGLLYLWSWRHHDELRSH